MSVVNTHASAPDKTVTGHGYGYIAEKMEAPNTNRQFTSQEVYITH